MKSIEIGKIIRAELLKNKELSKAIKGNIYPIIAPSSTPFPFLVYKKNNITTEYCKDGNVTDFIDFSIIVADQNYDTVVSIANLIRSIIECKKSDTIQSIKLDSVTESYNEEAYTQQLNFKITNINK